MTEQIHSQTANWIWEICNLLRGPYKRNEYRRVILPMTVLKRFDDALRPTKEKALETFYQVKDKPERIVDAKMKAVTNLPFYNVSQLHFGNILDDPSKLAMNLNGYIDSFSENVREIFQRFKFSEEIQKMDDKNLLYEVVKSFKNQDLSPAKISNLQMGYIFEELIRIGAEQSNEEAGHHFTPREVIKLMVNVLLGSEDDLAESHKVKMIYDPAAGTGGMLSEAEKYIRRLNGKARPFLYGQDYNDEAWATCKSDMLIKGEESDNIRRGNSFTEDGFPDEKFDYMLANPPFGVSWDQDKQFITKEAEKLGYNGRFGAGLPRTNDGALLFLQHMIDKMRNPEEEGSRIAVVFNGSPLFTGDAGSGESNIRKWIIENDWLEAVIALPDQLFYNTGISTYVWIVTNRKEEHRKGKVQLVDARQFYIKMRKSLGQKRHRIGDKDEEGQPDQIGEITRIYGNFKEGETRTFTIDDKQKERVVSKVFDNEDFGYNKVTVERPLRMNFVANAERIARLEDQKAFQKLTTSQKKNEEAKQKDREDGQKRQQAIRELLKKVGRKTGEKLFKDREAFFNELNNIAKSEEIDLSAGERKFIQAALGEKDETAEICRDSKGNSEPDPDLRDTEIIPLKEDIDAYFKREVLPHVPDAWIDHSKTKIGYEIPLNRYFYHYEPPRPLEEIEGEMKQLETEIMEMLKDMTNGEASEKEAGISKANAATTKN